MTTEQDKANLILKNAEKEADAVLARARTTARNLILDASLDRRPWFQRIEVADVLALLLVGAVVISNWRGAEFMIPQALLIIVGWYFGRKVPVKRS